MSIFNYYRPGVGGSFLLALVTLAGNLLVSLVLAVAFIVKNGRMPLPEDILSMNMLLMYLSAFIPVAVFILLRSRFLAKAALNTPVSEEVPACGCAPAHGNPKPLEAPRFGSFGALKTVASVALLTFFLIFLLEPLDSILPDSSTVEFIFKAMKEKPFWAVLSTCVAAPICEELLCRGFMLRGMLKSVKPWQAIVISAFLFALIHGNITQGVSAFLIALFLGWVYYRTGSILVSMMVHFIVNATSTVFALVSSNPLEMESIYESFAGDGRLALYVVIWVAVAAAGCLITRYLNRMLPAEGNF